MKIVTWYRNCIPFLIIVTSWTVHGAACAKLCPPREVPRRSSGPRLRPRPPRLTEVRMENTAAPYVCLVVVRLLSGRSVNAQGCHDLSKGTLLASRIIRGERSQVLSGRVVVAFEQPVLLVFLSTIQVTRTPHVFFAPPCIPDDRTAMALISAARSTRPPPIPEVDQRTGREGVAQLGMSRHGRPFVACASVAGRLPLPASAPSSAPVSAARRSQGWLARAFGARHARSRLRGGGGGGDGTRRGGRLFVFLAAPRARCWRGLCLGPSSLFFRGRCEPKTPGVGPVDLRVGGRGLCGEMALQKHAGCIISAY